MPVSTLVQSLLDVLQKNLARAERDNDLIYHKDIPPPSAIAPIQPVLMAQPTLLPGLSDPRSVVGGDRVLFGELLSWGAREAVSTLFPAITQSSCPIRYSDIYNDNKQILVKERITDFAQELDNQVDQSVPSLYPCPPTDRQHRTLRSLNLPSSLEALERPIGLPPSFLKKAEQVRSEQGPERIETFLENVELLAHRAMALLDEV